MDNKTRNNKDLLELLSQENRKGAGPEFKAELTQKNGNHKTYDRGGRPIQYQKNLNNMTAAAALHSDDPEAQHFREYLNSIIESGEIVPESNESRLEKEVQLLRNELHQAQKALKEADIHDFPHPYNGAYQKLVNAGLAKSHAAILIRKTQSALKGQEIVNERHIIHLIQGEMSSLFQDYHTFVQKPQAGPRIAVLIGATGVGKTTTLMKLAANPSLMAAQKVAIVSTDSYSMAASYDLEVFSRITKIQFEKANSVQELDAVISSLHDFDLILVDTPARSPAFKGFIHEIQEVLNVLKPTDVFLTLNMAYGIEDLFMSAGMFMPLNPTGLIFSKVDETCKQGKMVTLAAEIGIPIAFVCDGQNIPETIHVPNGTYVWGKLMKALDN